MTYRDAVLHIADKARQALTSSVSRIDKAVTLVLHGRAVDHHLQRELTLAADGV